MSDPRVLVINNRGSFLVLAEAHAPQPADRTAILSSGLLLFSLVAIVGLAKTLTPAVEFGIAYLGVPKAVVGIISPRWCYCLSVLRLSGRPKAIDCRPA